MIIGFHGCNKEDGEAYLSGDRKMAASKRDYDWLGEGIYFWENDCQRAWEWACFLREKGSIAEPFVVGAVIDLGNCLDLTLRENLELLRFSHENLKDLYGASKKKIPVNKDVPGDTGKNKLRRLLDCAVINNLHELSIVEFDSVRGLFIEGAPVYEGAYFMDLSHTQVAVRNVSKIKGIFRVPDPE